MSTGTLEVLPNNDELLHQTQALRIAARAGRLFDAIAADVYALPRRLEQLSQDEALRLARKCYLLATAFDTVSNEYLKERAEGEHAIHGL